MIIDLSSNVEINLDWDSNSFEVNNDRILLLIKIKIEISLVGNKSDLDSYRKVNFEEAKIYSEQNDLFFMETSAKTGSNIEELFAEIAKKLRPLNFHNSDYNGLKLEDQNDSKKKECCENWTFYVQILIMGN